MIAVEAENIKKISTFCLWTWFLCDVTVMVKFPTEGVASLQSWCYKPLLGSRLKTFKLPKTTKLTKGSKIIFENQSSHLPVKIKSLFENGSILEIELLFARSLQRNRSEVVTFFVNAWLWPKFHQILKNNGFFYY